MKYKVRIARYFQWKHEKRCYMGISLQQPDQRGERLQAIVDWINRNFEQAHLILADTLNRHNFMLEFCESPEQATIRSRLAGDQWLVENSPILQDLAVQWKMTRWDHWLADPRYLESRDILNQLYGTRDDFRQALRVDSDRFLQNMRKRGIDIYDVNFAERQCVEYLLEELSMLPLFTADLGTLEVYPSTELASAQFLKTFKLQESDTPLVVRTQARLDVEHRRRKRRGANSDSVDPLAA